ncbi:hypothetical protein [Paenibacillus protaetiae]|uniref:SRPBCC family protein n=1 Tax=Paenibacillus protaetiae TaxID=2509456 RepID=A0A4P6ET18_9BACL|nr:hypothetical protein [Paenibacillus protaetiae]QAY66074.1 hypothetical protein ET464_06390 [Paenibacillus protaetiae]
MELWPERLSHYRRTAFRQGSGEDGGIVEMAAVRAFRNLRWPVWWVSTMEVNRTLPVIRYRHIKGVTKGMDVEWRFQETDGGVKVSIIHQWMKPPLLRRLAANGIGRIFVHHIADQTLAGLARQIKQAHHQKEGTGIWQTSGSL